MMAVRSHFRPEFLNRLDEIIMFHRLTRADMAGIVTIQLRRLQQLLADRKIALELDDSARGWLAEAGYDPVYGARPLKRVIQRSLQNPLARSEEHTSELQSLMRISYAVFCLKKKKQYDT